MSLKSPIDESTLKKIAEYAADVVKTYGIEYLKAFKNILIASISELADAQIAAESKSEATEEAPVPVSFLVANILNTDTKRKAGKKYTAYNVQVVVVKPSGSSFKTMPIRYSAFKEFDEKIKSIAKKENLPHVPPKKIFNRLDRKVIEERQTTFQEYLKALTNLPNIFTEEQVIKFLKLKAENAGKYAKIYNKTFKEAYKNTCAAFKRKPADVSTEVDALIELVIEIANTELKPDIEKRLPKDAKIHSRLVTFVDEGIGKAVSKAVQVAWAAASSVLDTGRKTVIDIFESKTKLVVEANKTVKTKIDLAVSKILDPAIEQVVKVAQLVGSPLAKGVTLFTQDLIKQKQNTIVTITTDINKEVADIILNSNLNSEVYNFKKAVDFIHESLKLASQVGKDTFPILTDFTGILNTTIDILAIHFQIIIESIVKIYIAKLWAEKELVKEPSSSKFLSVIEEMQMRTRKIIVDAVSSYNKHSWQINWDMRRAFERYPNVGDELYDFADQLPGFDLDALETFRQELGIQAKNAAAQAEPNKDVILALFRKVMRDAAYTAMEFSQTQVLGALSVAFRSTIKKAALYKLQEEFIPKCLDLAKPLSDAIPDLLKDMGFDLPQLVADAVSGKAEEGVDKVLDAVAGAVLESLKGDTSNQENKE